MSDDDDGSSISTLARCLATSAYIVEHRAVTFPQSFQFSIIILLVCLVIIQFPPSSARLLLFLLLIVLPCSLVDDVPG